LIKDKVFSENVGVTQALEHGIHEASVPMIAESYNAWSQVGRPYVGVYRWYSIIFGIVCLEKSKYLRQHGASRRQKTLKIAHT
jgi:hypothetical protein